MISLFGSASKDPFFRDIVTHSAAQTWRLMNVLVDTFTRMLGARSGSREAYAQPKDGLRAHLMPHPVLLHSDSQFIARAHPILADRTIKMQCLQMVRKLTVVFFAVCWLVVTPLALVYLEGWSPMAAFYFAVQAGTGIGFGALNVESADGTFNRNCVYMILIVQLVVGAVLVTELVTVVITHLLAKAEDTVRAQTAATPASIDLGSEPVPWRGLAISCGCLLLILGVGTAYGTLYEGWSIARSVLFIISLCQTSGLEAPSITSTSVRPQCPSSARTMP